MDREDSDHELMSKPLADKNMNREEEVQKEKSKEKEEEIETRIEERDQRRELDSFIRFILYLFSFLLGPFGVGILIGVILLNNGEKEFIDVGRTCIILATVPALLIILLILFFISLAFIISIGSLFM